MLDLVRKHRRPITGLLLLCCFSALGACASQKDPPALVSDPEHGKESSLPWNKQERWELAPGIPEQLGESR
jgi:hypothetical protein